jgi:hypothetical protein
MKMYIVSEINFSIGSKNIRASAESKEDAQKFIANEIYNRLDKLQLEEKKSTETLSAGIQVSFLIEEVNHFKVINYG